MSLPDTEEIQIGTYTDLIFEPKSPRDPGYCTCPKPEVELVTVDLYTFVICRLCDREIEQ